MIRPTRETLHIQTALIWAHRSLCHHQSCGCVITDISMKEIIAFGYNGPAKKLPNDRCRKNAPAVSKDTPAIGTCGCLHAEANAVARSGGIKGDKVAFVSHAPCEQCAQLLVNSDVVKLYFVHSYRNIHGLNVLNDCKVQVTRMIGDDWR